MTDSSVLVSGGAGFIGSHVVARLLTRGDRVTVVDDLSTGSMANLGEFESDVEVRLSSFERFLAVEPNTLGRFSTIFHLAGNPYIPPSVEDPGFDYRKNLELTFRLLEAVRATPSPPRVVFASSAAVYGNPAKLPMHEADATFPISPYGVAKLAAERYVAVFSQLYEIPASSVRLFSVYGPRQHKQVVFDLIDRLSSNPRELEVIGDGTQARDFGFVEDVAAAFVHVASRAPGAGEVFNVASGTTHTIAQLVETICGVMQVTPDVSYTGSVRPGDAERWEVDLGALRALDFTPDTALADGIAATWDWYRASRER